MPLLFQLLQSSSFALSFSARYRHVALGLRGSWNCSVFAGEYGKRYPGQTQSQSEQHTKINEPAFAEPPSSRSRGTTANREARAGICGSAFAKATADRFRGGFLFHYWNLVLCEEHSRGVETLSAPLSAGWMLGFKRPQDAGNTVLAAGPDLVKLFQRSKVKLPAAMPGACRGSSAPLLDASRLS